MIEAQIKELIIEANKLGGKGVQVVGVREPEVATEDYILVTRTPERRSASEPMWYD